jgi:hypothetical protein
MLHLTVASRPPNEKAHPVKVDFFGCKAIVQVPDALAQLVQQTD